MAKLLLASGCSLALVAATLEPKLVAHFPLKHAAVTSVVQKFPGSSSPALLATTYAAIGSEPVYFVKDLANAVRSGGSNAEVTELETKTSWTNYVNLAPTAAFGTDTVVVTAGGFLVPLQGTGTIDLWEVSDLNHVKRTKVSNDKSGWFYHKIVWHDVNGDGLLDIVAARAIAPSEKKGELIWLEHPVGNALSNTTTDPWREHILCSGPDVDFIFEDVDGDGRHEVIATQFFSAPQLAMYSCAKNHWSECDESSITVTVIDRESGPFFSVVRTDINGDGRLDILVSNNQDDGTGAVFAYEQPSNILAGTWTKHVLASGYKPLPTLLPNPPHARGAPGASQAFWPLVSNKSSKPWILVSGDDAGFAAVLKPTSDSVDTWSYSQEFFVNSTGTIGTPSAADVDGDGKTELVVPFYNDAKIEIYTFSDKPEPAPLAQCIACLDQLDPVHLSSSHSWCYKDQQCHAVGSFLNPCSSDECASAAGASKCKCTTCNDEACHAPRMSTLVI
mmetsp:Transcript_76419/g.224205  ORF Transcript_76419/g.224205 Transcript_76419/m.224205 type:complete len:504 (+) Transcript_76419:53-1564(+)